MRSSKTHKVEESNMNTQKVIPNRLVSLLDDSIMERVAKMSWAEAKQERRSIIGKLSSKAFAK